MWYLNNLHNFRCNWHKQIWGNTILSVSRQSKWGRQMRLSSSTHHLLTTSVSCVRATALCTVWWWAKRKALVKQGRFSEKRSQCVGGSLHRSQPSFATFHQLTSVNPVVMQDGPCYWVSLTLLYHPNIDWQPTVYLCEHSSIIRHHNLPKSMLGAFTRITFAGPIWQVRLYREVRSLLNWCPLLSHLPFFSLEDRLSLYPLWIATISVRPSLALWNLQASNQWPDGRYPTLGIILGSKEQERVILPGHLDKPTACF